MKLIALFLLIPTVSWASAVQVSNPPANGNAITPSSVTVTGASGNCLSADGTTFNVDCTNHRVGVGTASPTAKLHVYGAGNTFSMFDASSGSNSGINLAEGGSITGYIYHPTGTATTVIADAGGGAILTASTGHADATGAFGFYSRTIAQLQAITPTAVGQAYYCSNCSPAKLVISTGTLAGNFADAVGSTFK